MSWYGTWRRQRGGNYEVGICTRHLDDLGKLTTDLDRGQVLVVAVERKLTTLKLATTRKLRATYNTKWRGESPRMSATAFARCLKLRSIIVDATGGALVVFVAGDLFRDHVIEVRLSWRAQATRIALAG